MNAFSTCFYTFPKFDNQYGMEGLHVLF